MAYQIGTLSSGRTRPANENGNPVTRFAGEFALLAGGLLWLLVALALITHAPSDAAWSTSGVAGRAIANRAGILGAWASDLVYYAFGFSAWWLMLVGACAWLRGLATLLRSGEAGSGAHEAHSWRSTVGFWLGVVALMASSCALEWGRIYRYEQDLPNVSGGLLGQWLGEAGVRWFGYAGSGLLWIALLVAGAALALRFSWVKVADVIGGWIDGGFRRARQKAASAVDERIGQKAAQERAAVVEEKRHEEEIHPAAPVVIEPTLVEVPRSERVVKERQKPLFKELPDSDLPQVELLDAPPGRQDDVPPETLEMTSRLIEKKLSDFGVEVHVVTASPGPVITRYEFEPATGVKGSQIVNLAKDLARSLGIVSLRVVETVPGRTTMALELPNAKRHMIRLSEVLGSSVYHEAKSLLTLGLGKDIVGNPIVADLAKMPHLLVAGTTGSGKSVGINGMILSLLYKAEPSQVRLMMVDPKMLEMSVYEGIPHLLCPVITDMKQAANGLTWCVAEMEKRYKLMSKLGVRNLAGFNTRIAEAEAKGESIPNPFSLTPESPEPLERLPYVVVVIDELADLMMVVGKKIEELIARLAQKARAAGIHLVLATQRPSVDVITGLIKANIPTRIAFQVSSKIDSRTILDQMGAESLLGMGDMLYLPPGTGLPMRVHGAFVSDDEVHRVVEYLKSQGEPNYIEGILEGGTLDGEGGAAPGEGDDESDPLYDQAVAVVLKNRRASISLVQRHLKIGYNRAARILEQMEKSGLVSPMATNGNRDILVPAHDE